MSEGPRTPEHPEMNDPLVKMDTWARRLHDYFAVAGYVVVGTTLTTAFLMNCILPKMQLIAPIAWVILSVGGVTLGFLGNNRLRTAATWRFTCIIAAMFSLAVWGYSLSAYQTRKATEDIPRGYELQILTHSELAELEKVDPEKIRGEEREKIKAEYAKRSVDTHELLVTWTWLFCCLLWSVTLLHAVNRTEQLLALTLYRACGRVDHLTEEDDKSS